MKRTIILEGQPVKYRLLKRRGNKYMRLSFSPVRGLSVSAPKYYPLLFIEGFLRQQAQWIWDKIHDFQSAPKFPTAQEYVEKKEMARTIITERAFYFARLYGLSFQRITIRNQTSRWGSCSKQTNLNFSYRVAFLPDRLRDYVIVHELCHLQQMNHSQKFWRLVAQVAPDWKTLRKQLRLYSLTRSES